MQNLTFNYEIIKDYLIENHLTIKQFCQLCNIKYYNFRQIAKNDLNVRSNVLYKICKTMNMKLRDIISVKQN